MTRKFSFFRDCQKIRRMYVKFQAGLTGVCVCVCGRALVRACVPLAAGVLHCSVLRRGGA